MYVCMYVYIYIYSMAAPWWSAVGGYAAARAWSGGAHVSEGRGERHAEAAHQDPKRCVTRQLPRFYKDFIRISQGFY